MVVMEVGRGRQAWAKTFDGWRAGEEKIVDLGTLFPRVQQIQKYSLCVDAISVEARSSPIRVTSERLLSEEISLDELARVSSPERSLAVDQANTIEHPDYLTQLKLPVMTNCAKKYPQYGEPFQECQGLIFKWRNRCATVERVTTPAFVECVRKGLKGEAPELLERP